jgi:hypothetical protein
MTIEDPKDDQQKRDDPAVFGDTPQTELSSDVESPDSTAQAADKSPIDDRIPDDGPRLAEVGILQSAQGADTQRNASATPNAPVDVPADSWQSPPYEPRPLHPTMWKIDPIEAANNTATVFAAAKDSDIHRSVAASPGIETQPLLGGDGEPPKHVDETLRALFLWEAAAAEAIGDPRFTPKPTSKPREQLTSISRGPLFPDVWLDQQTLQPVLFDGEDPYAPLEKRPWQRPGVPLQAASPTRRVAQPRQASAALTEGAPESPPLESQHQPSATRPGDGAGVSGMAWPVLRVQLAEQETFFQAELGAFADRQRVIAREEAHEVVYEYHSWQVAEERALWGKD